MAHWSEDARRLDLQEHQATSLADMMAIDSVSEPAVYLFWFPAARTDEMARQSEEFLRLLLPSYVGVFMSTQWWLF
jgi:hypothetical protein